MRTPLTCLPHYCLVPYKAPKVYSPKPRVSACFQEGVLQRSCPLSFLKSVSLAGEGLQALRARCTVRLSATADLLSDVTPEVRSTSNSAFTRLHPRMTVPAGRAFIGGSGMANMGSGLRQLRVHAASLGALPGNATGVEAMPAGSTAGMSGSSASGQVPEDDTQGYRVPPPEIAAVVDAPPTPALSFSPLRDRILFLHRRSLPPLADFARPELKMGGMRIDPASFGRSRSSSFSGMSIKTLAPDGTRGEEIWVSGLPDRAKIGFVSWAPNAQHIAFTVSMDDEEDEKAALLSLWVADVVTGTARVLLPSTEYGLCTIFDSYVWQGDDAIIACTIPKGRPPPPKKPLTPSGPRIQSNAPGQVAQSRTYQDLLKDKHDEALFEYYCTSELTRVDLSGTVMQFAGPQMYTSLAVSPDDNFLLVASLHRPFSFLVPCGRFPKRVELWNASGAVLQELAFLPLAEDIPIAFNSVRKGKRSISWRPDKPATVYWVETQDGGDARVEVSPRDILYSLDCTQGMEAEPKVFHTLNLRYGGVSWCDEDLALVYESWFKTRKTRTWVVAPGNPDKEAKVLFDRSYEDAYSDPGSPMSRRTQMGTYVLARISTLDGRRRLLLDGNGATPDGNVPFLDLLDIETGEKERIWQSDKEKYFESVTALMCDNTEDGDLPLEGLKILMSRETQKDPPQYYLNTFPSTDLVPITDFPHPYPQLRDAHKEIIKYSRKDGVQLTATLYLPPGYDAEKDGPLPMLMWAYPREFKSKDAAGQVRGSPNQFSSIGSTSPLLWLARRYAILDGPTFPIVGEGDEEANDTYVEQLVACAQAAVEEVVRRGVAEPGRLAIGGHSYGAFMTANLLAHAADLFACGIARSGAYNRTLTPFGFQSEERTLWEAPKVYMEMSPYMHANAIKKPLLLIHGEDDNNTGTFPMQSERFFGALKGHGGHTRLVILPFESHGYRARESVMHTLWEMDEWLRQHCNQAPTPIPVSEGEEIVKKTQSPSGSPKGPMVDKVVTIAGVEGEVAPGSSEGEDGGPAGQGVGGQGGEGEECEDGDDMSSELGELRCDKGGKWTRIATGVLGREPHSCL